MEVQILPNTITLENEKVLLRPLEISDIDHLLEFSLHEPEIWKYSLAQGSGKENMIKYIYDAVLARASNKEYSFIVLDKIKNKYAGSTRFYDIQLAYKTIQLGYTWYGKEFQGTGLNKNCKYLLLEALAKTASEIYLIIFSFPLPCASEYFHISGSFNENSSR